MQGSTGFLTMCRVGEGLIFKLIQDMMNAINSRLIFNTVAKNFLYRLAPPPHPHHVPCP